MDKALVLLLSKLSAVNGLPKDSDTPTVRTSNSDDSPVARLALVSKDGANVDVETLGQYLDTNIVEPLSRVEGIAEVDYYGGSHREIRVLIDPNKLVQYQITLGEVLDALRDYGATCTFFVTSDCVTRDASGLALLRARQPLEAEDAAVAHARVVLDVGLDADGRTARRSGG